MVSSDSMMHAKCLIIKSKRILNIIIDILWSQGLDYLKPLTRFLAVLSGLRKDGWPWQGLCWPRRWWQWSRLWQLSQWRHWLRWLQWWQWHSGWTRTSKRAKQKSSEASGGIVCYFDLLPIIYVPDQRKFQTEICVCPFSWSYINQSWFDINVRLCLTLFAPGGGGWGTGTLRPPVTYLRINVKTQLSFPIYEFGKGQYAFYRMKLSRFAKWKFVRNTKIL